MTTTMTFSGDNLALVRSSLNLALDELHNMIATCPDIVEHAEAIEEYEQEQKRVRRLATRIDKKLGAQNANQKS